MECTCPENVKDIPEDKKVQILTPGEIYDKVKIRISNIITYHADCPIHGYKVISTEIINEP